MKSAGPQVLTRLASISPSRLTAMSECRLREIYGADSTLQPPLPSSPAAIAGTMAHKLIEDAGRGVTRPGEASARLSSLVKQWEDALGPDSPDRRWLPIEGLPEFAARARDAIQRAEDLMSGRTTRASTRQSGRPATGFELAASVRDGKVRGRIDRVLFRNGGLVIQDLKTGPITSSRLPGAPPKPAYSAQMLLYAAMYAEDPNLGDGRWPDVLELISLKGQAFVVPFSRTDCTAILNQAEALLDDTNAIIDTLGNTNAGRLATPSPQTCVFCRYRPLCPEYSAAARSSDRTDDGTDEWPCDVWGRVLGIQKLGNGTLAVSLMLDDDQPMYIRGLNQRVHTALNTVRVDSELAVFSARVGPGTRTLVEGRFTTVTGSNPGA